MSTPTPSTCEIAIALDLPDREGALRLLDRLGDRSPWVKIGLQLFTRYGPSLVEEIASRGSRIFLDLKLHDIPNTVAGAVESLAHLPVELLTIHGLGGPAMIVAAVGARDRCGVQTKILAVTILTSMDENQMNEVGLTENPGAAAHKLAQMALRNGADGLVCSAHEVEQMRSAFGTAPTLVVPGIRPAGAESGDQKRIMTPSRAARLGSSLLVIGRPVVQATDPAAAYDRIAAEIEEA